MRRIQFDYGDKVFLVVADKAHRNMADNVVLMLKIDSIVVNEYGVTYTGRPEKIMMASSEHHKKMSSYSNFYSFKDDNVDTGYHTVKYMYPVFTTKEKCIKYLKG